MVYKLYKIFLKIYFLLLIVFIIFWATAGFAIIFIIGWYVYVSAAPYYNEVSLYYLLAGCLFLIYLLILWGGPIFLAIYALKNIKKLLNKVSLTRIQTLSLFAIPLFLSVLIYYISVI